MKKKGKKTVEEKDYVLTLPPELRKRLKEHADKYKVPISSIIKMVLVEYLEKHERKEDGFAKPDV